jgi:hypothetical protein
MVAFLSFVGIIGGGTAIVDALDDSSKDKAPAESTTTTKPEDTPSTTDSSSGDSTTSTTEATTTTSTPSDDDAEDCGEGIFGSLTCDTPAPDPDDGDLPPGDPGSEPGEPCEVSLQNMEFPNMEDGKMGENNFARVPAVNLSDPDAGIQLVGYMEDQSCRSPVRMIADMVAAGFIPKLSEGELNARAAELVANPSKWQDMFTLLQAHHANIVSVKVSKSDGKQFHTMEMRDPPTGKDLPWLGYVKTKGSCIHIVTVTYKDGHVEVFCVECGMQPRWEEVPEPTPATPVTPPSSTPRPPRPTTTTTQPRPTTTTTQPRPTTTTTQPPRRMCPPPYQNVPVPPEGVEGCPKDRPEERPPSE